MFERLILLPILALAASPALAQGAASVPEGSQLTLFALGVLGVIIGRRASMTRRSDRD